MLIRHIVGAETSMIHCFVVARATHDKNLGGDAIKGLAGFGAVGWGGEINYQALVEP